MALFRSQPRRHVIKVYTTIINCNPIYVFCLSVNFSAAIMKYIAIKYKLDIHWYPWDEVEKSAKVDEYLHWHHLNIRKPFVTILLELVSLIIFRIIKRDKKDCQRTIALNGTKQGERLFIMGRSRKFPQWDPDVFIFSHQCISQRAVQTSLVFHRGLYKPPFSRGAVPQGVLSFFLNT